MKEKNFSRRTKALMIAVSVVAFLGICLVGAEFWLKRKILAAIEKEAAALTGGVMEVGVGRISVSIPARSVTVRDIRLRSQNDDPGQSGFVLVSLDAGVEKISLRGVGYKKKNGKPALSAGSITIDGPYATLVTKGEKPDSEDGAGKKTLQQSITEKLNSVTVGGIRISGARLDYVAWKDNDLDGIRIGLEDGSLAVDGFMLDSLPVAAGKVFFSDDIVFMAGRISYGYGGGDFVLQADTVSVNTAGRSLSLRTAALIPQYPKNEFAQKSAKHSDWTEFTLRGLNLAGVDYAGLINNNVLTVDSLTFASGHIASYKNRQVWQEPRVKPMLYQTIQDLPIGLDVKKLSFTDLGIEYDELAADGDSPGVVVFTEGSGTARNITNIVEGHDRFMTIDMSANLMDNGPLHAVFLFPVSPQDDRWKVKGRMGTMDPAALNRAIEPLADIKIKRGTIHSVDFHVTGTLAQSHTTLTMLYDDLSVAFMKKHESKERKFMTFVADELVLHKKNPAHNGKVRTGEGDFTRDPQKSMYNFLWKSIFQGMKDTVM